MGERRRRASSDERGSALLVSTVTLAMAVVLALGLERIGDSAVVRARADATADIVALASVTGGRASAERVAKANGATVVATAAAGAGREVTIEVGGDAVRGHRPAGLMWWGQREPRLSLR